MSAGQDYTEQLKQMLGQRRPRRPRRRWLRNALLFVLGMAVPIALCAGQVVRCYRVQGEAMEPTLRPGDLVLAAITAYRGGTLPRYGDVVLFSAPPQSQAGGEILAKRVVGLPGDQIAVRRGYLWRNGRIVDEPYLRELMSFDWTCAPCPAGHLVVLGDNRNQSQDSHTWTIQAPGEPPEPAPFVAVDSLIGRVALIFWPLHRVSVVRRG
ncbi:MAG: signal peptidase I [Armatimonadetes bacterium]|nr:signal peptidase I [Armatimonadota bacterium]